MLAGLLLLQAWEEGYFSSDNMLSFIFFVLGFAVILLPFWREVRKSRLLLVPLLKLQLQPPD
ncbi:hypothetical protein A0257_00120 [Hymenobacter psoromatis]|nr:hypothetical protein A0257_00120 [Hymenobacter psoromatis]